MSIMETVDLTRKAIPEKVNQKNYSKMEQSLQAFQEQSNEAI
jgi:hypothetical protein